MSKNTFFPSLHSHQQAAYFSKLTKSAEMCAGEKKPGDCCFFTTVTFSVIGLVCSLAGLGILFSMDYQTAYDEGVMSCSVKDNPGACRYGSGIVYRYISCESIRDADIEANAHKELAGIGYKMCTMDRATLLINPCMAIGFFLVTLVIFIRSRKSKSQGTKLWTAIMSGVSLSLIMFHFWVHMWYSLSISSNIHDCSGHSREAIELIKSNGECLIEDGVLKTTLVTFTAAAYWHAAGVVILMFCCVGFAHYSLKLYNIASKEQDELENIPNEIAGVVGYVGVEKKDFDDHKNAAIAPKVEMQPRPQPNAPHQLEPVYQQGFQYPVIHEGGQMLPVYNHDPLEEEGQ